jgi:hypothetical protein
VFKTLDLLAPRTEVQVPEPAPAKPPEKVPEPSINLYGPALPPMALAASPAASVSITSSLVAPLSVVKNAEWVEKTKKHKRSRSREHSHKKRKHSKDEKKDKHYSSDDSYKKDKKKKHKKKHKR